MTVSLDYCREDGKAGRRTLYSYRLPGNKFGSG